MDYLAILKSMDTGKAETSNVGAAVAERSGEKSELSERSPVHLPEPAQRETPVAVCESAQAIPKPVERGPNCPGPDHCAGCYSVGVLDGRERFIHPPRASAEWEAWLRRWQPKGGTQ